MQTGSNKTNGIFLNNNENRYNTQDWERIRKNRRAWFIVVVIVWIIALFIRLYYVQIVDIFNLQALGKNQHVKTITIQSERG